jgi:outer membrane receptor protein involved in Fe transport
MRLLDDLAAQDLGDLMGRHLGGVMVQDLQGNALQPDVHYRGFTASPLLGTPQGLSVYLDGVRMNQPFGDVVSWDLIPRAALQSLTLMPGSNPLFGLNTLGGSLALQTKDGRSAPGTSMELKLGSHDRRNFLLEHGFANDLGLDGYSMVNLFHDGGWRKQSPSDVRQLFGKLRWRAGVTRSQLSMAWADNDLQGNGLQEGSQLSQNWKSVYTTPDTTRHQAFMLNWLGSHEISDRLTVSAQVYARGQNGNSLNGDINEASLTQAPTNYPECLAHALAKDEAAEVCSGLLTRSITTQRNHGLVLQSNWEGQQGAAKTQTLLGAALDIGHMKFKQWGQAGYVNSDRSVTGVPAWSNGIDGGDVNGQPWDTDVELQGRNETRSLFVSRTWSWAGGWNLTTSGRYNRTQVSNLDLRKDGTTGSLSGDYQFNRFNPAIGLTLAPSPIWQGWVGYNEGSRTPTTTELGCANPEIPCRLPNSMASDPPLKQVVTRTLEVGMRGLWVEQYRWSASLFRAVSDDDILFVASEQSGFGYFRNFGQTLRQGLELSLSGPLNAQWQYGLHYNWLKATYQSAEMVGGHSNSSNSEGPGLDGHIQIRPGDRIPLIPSQMFKLHLGYKPSAAWRFGLDLQAVGRSSARGNENGQHQSDGVYYTGPGHNPGYAVIHLSAKYAPSPGWNLSAQINNLLDMRYTTAAVLSPNAFIGNNVVSQPFGANAQGDIPLRHGTFYAPGEPRNIWLGARYVWR